MQMQMQVAVQVLRFPVPPGLGAVMRVVGEASYRYSEKDVLVGYFEAAVRKTLRMYH
jgi:hypothetical protein